MYFNEFLISLAILEEEETLNDENDISDLRPQLKRFFQTEQISADLILRAAKHISEKNIDGVIQGQSEAFGEFYELLAYEITVAFGAENDDVRYVVSKGQDALKQTGKYRIDDVNDGLFYENRTKMVVRGDGRTIGEYDLILFDKFGDILYCEVKKNKMGFRKPIYKIQYKKKILEELFGCRVDLLLVYAEEPSNIKENSEIVKGTGGDFSIFNVPNESSLTDVLSTIGKKELHCRTKKESEKLILWDDLVTLKKLNYADNHAQLRSFLLSVVELKEPIDIIRRRIRSSLVERVFMGKIIENDIHEFLNSVNLSVDGEHINIELFKEKFSEIILGLSVPKLNPMLYLKTISQNGYQKTMPDKDGVFIIDEKIEKGGGFFKAISRTEEIIESKTALDIINTVMKGTTVKKNSQKR